MLFFLYILNLTTYVLPQIGYDVDKFNLIRWLEHAHAALEEHPRRTPDPEKADFFVVGPTLTCVSFSCPIRILNFNKTLPSLRFHVFNKPHVFFDLSDRPSSIYSNRNFPLHSVSFFKSAFSRKYYRRKLDVSIPQFQRYVFSKLFIDQFGRNKSILVSFVGDFGHNKALRSGLLMLNNTNGAEIRSSNEPEYSFPRGLEVMQINMSVEKPFSYLNCLMKSRFSILIKGRGYALSYRHLEAMSVGSIPVIVADDYVLPFEELINWSSCALIVPEADIPNLVNIVRQNVFREEELRRNVQAVYYQYFRSIKVIIETAISIFIRKREALPRSQN